MQYDKEFREQVRLFRRGGGGPVLAEFEQAIGGKKLFVVQDAEKGLVVCGERGDMLEGFDHLLDRVGTKCGFLRVPVSQCLEKEFAKLSIACKQKATPKAVFWKEVSLPTVVCGKKDKRVGCTQQVSKILARYAAPSLSREFQYDGYWNPTRNQVFLVFSYQKIHIRYIQQYTDQQATTKCLR